MDYHCQLCGRNRHGIEWNGTIPHNPEEVQEQIHVLEHMQNEIRADEAMLSQLLENRSELCPMCMEITDGIRDSSDEEELDTRITLQVAYLEDQLERWNVKHL